MPAPLKSIWTRAQGVVGQFSLAQRTLAIIGVAGVILGAIALSSWLGKSSMTPLFSSLSGKDAQAVVDELDASGVQYQLADGGTTVLVPSDQVYAMRIKLAAEGLPENSDGEGYSLLDGMSVTASQFQQQTTYQRAVEGELAKTIEAMDGIDTASVKLAIPEDSVFVEEKSDPTASVFVQTRAGVTLDSDQVQAIVHLVSAGIDGMKSTDVAVIDSSGQVLSTVGGTGGTGGLSDGQTGDYEARIKSAVQQILDPLVGAGNSAVTVTAELNYDSSSKTIETFQADPTTPPLAQSTTSEEYSGDGASGETGVLGPDNIAVPSDSATSGAGSYKSTTEDRTNAVDKTTEQITVAPGGVERQSVAVVINSESGAALDMTQVQQAIAAAAGIDTQRGDTVSVVRAPFDTTAATAAQTALKAAAAETKKTEQVALIKQGAIAGLVVLVLLIAFISSKRRSKKARREALDLGDLQAGSPSGGGVQAGQIEGVGTGLPELPYEPEPTLPDPVATKRHEIAAMAEEQPEEIAEVLRGWLAESGARR